MGRECERIFSSKRFLAFFPPGVENSRELLFRGILKFLRAEQGRARVALGECVYDARLRSFFFVTFKLYTL